MRVKSLYLNNFRIFKEAFFEFSPSLNLIYGPNAHGKTTILEAIHLLITGRSFRTHQMSDLIRRGEERFIVEAHFVKHGVEQKLKFTSDGKEKRIIHNQTQCRTFADLFGLMHGIAITPDDVTLIKGAPAMRRQFLDIQLAQGDPLYVHHLSRYNRAMKQRNLLLRARKQEALSVWEQEMSKSASYIVEQRRHAAQILNQTANQIHQQLSSSAEKFQVAYRTTAPLELVQQHYLELWRKQRPREMELGFTIGGLHKDDLELKVADQEARYFASEGQQRSCITSLRLAGWQQLKQSTEVSPLMLVDDVGVSMDFNRRKELFSLLTELEQVFLTTTDSLELPTGSASIFLH